MTPLRPPFPRFLFSLLCALCVLCGSLADAATRPNIITVFIDDMG